MSGIPSGLVDRVVVVNLDRRRDRMRTVDEQLRALGVPYLRFAAVDGRDPEVAAAWRSYAAQPLAEALVDEDLAVVEAAASDYDRAKSN